MIVLLKVLIISKLKMDLVKHALHNVLLVLHMHNVKVVLLDIIYINNFVMINVQNVIMLVLIKNVMIVLKDVMIVLKQDVQHV